MFPIRFPIFVLISVFFVGECVLCETEIDQRFSAIENVLREQGEKLADQTLEISQLKKTVLSQNEEIVGLRKTVQILSQEQHGQKKSLSLLKSLIQRSAKIEVDVSDPTDDLTYKTEVKDEPVSEEPPVNGGARLRNLSLRDVTNSSHIAFHASLSHTEKNPSAHQTIIFDSASMNLQNAYNAQTGVFTAPANGIYAFFFSVRISNDAYRSFELVKNSQVLEVVFVNSNGWFGNMSSASSVISLRAGDVVFVRTHKTYAGVGDVYSNQYGRPHFSGYMVYSE